MSKQLQHVFLSRLLLELCNLLASSSQHPTKIVLPIRREKSAMTKCKELSSFLSAVIRFFFVISVFFVAAIFFNSMTHFYGLTESKEEEKIEFNELICKKIPLCEFQFERARAYVLFFWISFSQWNSIGISRSWYAVWVQIKIKLHNNLPLPPQWST